MCKCNPSIGHYCCQKGCICSKCTPKKIELGKKYQTRDGKPVRILCIDGPSKDYPIVGVIGNNSFVSTWTSTGQWNQQGGSFDLVEVKEKKKMYINVYQSVSGRYRVGGLHSTPAEARFCTPAVVDRYVATVPIEWEE